MSVWMPGQPQPESEGNSVSDPRCECKHSSRSHMLPGKGLGLGCKFCACDSYAPAPAEPVAKEPRNLQCEICRAIYPETQSCPNCFPPAPAELVAKEPTIEGFISVMEIDCPKCGIPIGKHVAIPGAPGSLVCPNRPTPAAQPTGDLGTPNWELACEQKGGNTTVKWYKRPQPVPQTGVRERAEALAKELRQAGYLDRTNDVNVIAFIEKRVADIIERAWGHDELQKLFKVPHFLGAPMVGDPITSMLHNLPRPHLSTDAVMVDRKWYERLKALASVERAPTGEAEKE